MQLNFQDTVVDIKWCGAMNVELQPLKIMALGRLLTFRKREEPLVASGCIE